MTLRYIYTFRLIIFKITSQFSVDSIKHYFLRKKKKNKEYFIYKRSEVNAESK